MSNLAIDLFSVLVLCLYDNAHVLQLLQAAKEFESELKKEPESLTEPPVDKPKPVAEEKKVESSSKEST